MSDAKHRRAIIEQNTFRIHLSCYEAYRSWHGDTKKFDGFSKLPLKNDNHFSDFLSHWRLSRSVPYKTRDAAICRMSTFQKEIRTATEKEEVWKKLEVSTVLLKGASGNNRCTSLFSKFAFCHSPKLFSPYDSFAFRAVNSLGIKVEGHAYIKFMTAFEEINETISTLIPNGDNPWEAYSKNFKAQRVDLERGLFLRRVTDKFLMLMGGYGDIKMRRELLKCTPTANHTDIDATLLGTL